MPRPTVVTYLENGPRERLRVALERIEGVDVVDLRVTLDLTIACRIQTPTKKGITLRAEKLPALIKALQQAEAILAGRIGGDT